MIMNLDGSISMVQTTYPLWWKYNKKAKTHIWIESQIKRIVKQQSLEQFVWALSIKQTVNTQQTASN